MSRPPSLLSVDTGERFRALRKALGLSTAEVARRTRGLLDRRVVERIETGGYKLSSERQRKGLSVAYGLSRAEIDALIENELSVDNAIAIAKGKTPEVPSPDSRAPGAGARSPEELGERMATAIALRQADLAPYPNLEFCLEYHRRNGKTWDASVVAAARAGYVGEQDLPTTGAWESTLDRLQAVMRHARIEAQARPKTISKQEKP
jgi:transcriptional regulator with XRE-family HTH domain